MLFLSITPTSMLQSLTILDLAVVKELELDLTHGMSALTGETGAGKSILLTAVTLALGERATPDYIRPNAARAEINLTFDVAHLPSAKAWLENNAFDDKETGQCLIRRVIHREGASKAYINNRPVTLQTLQQLTRQLVEIQGQHAHLKLLESDEQRRLLDNYAKNTTLLTQLNDSYTNWQQAKQALETLTHQRNEAQQREALLRYQFDELDALNLAQCDYENLSTTHRKLAHLEQILSTGQQQIDILYDQDRSLYAQIKSSLKSLSTLLPFAPELQSVHALLTEAQIQLEEAVYELRHFLEHQEINPHELEEIETQLGVFQALSRKHHVKPEELLARKQHLENELHQLNHDAQRIAELEQATLHWQSVYTPLAQQLSTQRKASAGQLQAHISSMMKTLGMPNGEFLIEITPLDTTLPKLNGSDDVRFLISTNVGLPPKSLSKVASGGELSRISLAIQVTTANDKTTPTLIFDEVDSGIGGGIAQIVGQKMRELSEGNRQVLCVTHLPQVAAQAHQHLYVQKDHYTDMTASRVFLLSEAERIKETARMLGGVDITAATLAHAKEMLENAKQAN